jgi:hypothetical protein
MTSLARSIRRGTAVIAKDNQGRLYVSRTKGANPVEKAIAEKEKNTPAMAQYIQGVTLPRIHANKLKSE